MKYIVGTKDFRMEGKTAVTFGKFDGLHRGHQKLFQKVLEQKAAGLKAVVFTFDMSPVEVLTGRHQKFVNTKKERYHFLEQLGIDYLIEYPFTAAVSRMDPEDFVREIIVDRLQAAYIAVGTDWRFGYQRQGSGALLHQLSAKYGYIYDGVEKEKDGDRIISSTYVREELFAGRLSIANRLLGYSFTIFGQVTHGNHFGRKMGLPTINLVPGEQKLLPPNGVYFSKTMVRGSCYGGITNIGCKPTVSADSAVVVETFLFDWEGDLYDEDARVCLLEFRRTERKFATVEELKNQIQQDVEAGRKYLADLGSYSGI